MKLKHNINRIEVFSDAVFAIVATLMVVSFDMNESSFLQESNTTIFLTFGISLLFYIRHFAICVLVDITSELLAKLHIGLTVALPGIICTLLDPLFYIHGVHFQQKLKTIKE